LEQGADVEAQGEYGMTALNGACFKGHLAVARVLLEHGAVVDTTNNRGDTPLIMASFGGRGEIVRLLLDNDADPTITINGGNTALSEARTTNRQGIVDMLEVQQKRGCRGRGGRRRGKRAFDAHFVVARQSLC
jgi:ankyrin repeat protein